MLTRLDVVQQWAEMIVHPKNKRNGPDVDLNDALYGADIVWALTRVIVALPPEVVSQFEDGLRKVINDEALARIAAIDVPDAD